MNDTQPGDWIQIAFGSLMAAKRCFEERQFRSCVSRAYYAMYQATTAMLTHAGLKPGVKGNWSHTGTAKSVADDRMREVLDKYRVRPVRLREDLIRSFGLRCDADYRPFKKIDEDAGRNMLRLANKCLTLARKVTSSHD